MNPFPTMPGTQKWILGLYIVAMVFFSPGCKDDDDNDFEKQMLAILETESSSYNNLFPGKSVGVFLATQSAEGFQFFQYGFDTPIHANMHFKGASTTKSFTAASILLLHQQGKLNIEDHIVDLIPGSDSTYIPLNQNYAIPYRDQITIRQLLGHRAGVFDVTNDNIPDTINAPYAGKRYVDYLNETLGEDHTFHFDELVLPVAEHQLFYFPPDAAMHYSNTGYNLLGKIVERISGMKLSEFKRVHFLEPLGMNQTHFVDDGTELVLPQPALPNYLHYDGEVIEFEHDNLSSAMSEGNIVTTATDLANWGYHLWGTNDFLSAAILTDMTMPRATGEHHVYYGLGCEMHPLELGHGHNGARIAFMTTLRYHPGTQTAYLAVSNTLYADDLFLEGTMLDNILRRAIKVVEEK